MQHFFKFDLLHLLQQKNINNMAIVSIKDFGIALKVPYGTIRSKISRKQICCNRSRLIDTENVKNFAYLLEVNGGNQTIFEPYDLKVKSKTIKKVVLEPKKVIKKPEKLDLDKVNNSKVSVKVTPTTDTKKIKLIEKIENQPKLTKDERLQLIEENKQRESLASFDVRKREAEVRLVERRAELAQFELEKKAGNTLPLDKVETLMAINYKSIFKSFYSQLKNIALITVQNLGGSKEDLNVIMKDLEKHLNHIVKMSKENAEKEIEKLVDEYSEVRSRGERK
jgi:hypothetical protein